MGIDVSKGRSIVTIRKPGNNVIMKPQNFKHTKSGINSLINIIKELDGETRVCLECTGRYHEPVASWLHNVGIFVSAVNPLLIKGFGGDSIRTPKTDKADAVKIARYTLDKWNNLKEYTHTDDVRNQLKTMNRQFDFYIKQKTAMKNNLIAILDQTYPGVNKFFTSEPRRDGSQKWVDFVFTFWHVNCVCSTSIEEFSSKYKDWCKTNGYIFNAKKAADIYKTSLDFITVLPMNDITKTIVQQAVNMLNEASKIVELFRSEMNKIASTLPEYPIVISMYGVGRTLGSQLIAEIGDVTRFEKRSSLTAFAGVDPKVNESGDKKSRNVPTTKKGSPFLRKTLFQIMTCLLQTQNINDPVYAFIDKKRREGKPYYLYMTAGANKLLRIYFCRVKKFLENSSNIKQLE